jgi:hypothetical protein
MWMCKNVSIYAQDVQQAWVVKCIIAKAQTHQAMPFAKMMGKGSGLTSPIFSFFLICRIPAIGPRVRSVLKVVPTAGATQFMMIS